MDFPFEKETNNKKEKESMRRENIPMLECVRKGGQD